MKKLFRKFTWLVAALMCLCVLFSVKTFAEESNTDDSLSGSIGESITWKLEGDAESGYTIRISGSGKTPDYEYTDDIPWYSHINEIKKVIVEDGITGLGGAAFYKSTSIQSVKLADSVRSIGRVCFYLNSSLEEIDFGSGVTSIGEAAFPKSKLKNIVLPSGVTRIEDDTFYGCSELESINLDNIKSIGRRAFFDCSSLSDIHLSTNLEKLEYQAFRRCSLIDNVIIGNKLSEISEQVFAECSSLTKIHIPDNITAIQRAAFYHCTSLKQVTGAKNVEVLGEMAFNGSPLLETYPLGNKVRSIGKSAFSGCSSFKIDKIPDSVTSMGNWAFSNTAIETLEFGSGLTYIDTYAFTYCSSLTKVVFSANIETIKMYAFSHCPKLKDVIFAEGLQTISEGTFSGSSIEEAIIPKSVSAIGNDAFPSNTKLTLLNDRLTNLAGNVYKVVHKAKASFYYNYDYAYEVLKLVNEIRKENNLEPMTMDVSLLDNAMYRASELALYFSHQSPMGTYDTSIGANENCAMWQLTPQEVVDSWMSDSHQFPILSSKYTALGVGAVVSNGALYWTQEFRSKVSKEAVQSSYKNGEQINTIEYTTDLVNNFRPEQKSVLIKENGESSIVSLLSRTTLLPDSVYYESSNEKVCTVSKDGKITGKKAGNATITIYAADFADEYALKTTVQVEVQHSWQSDYTVDKEATCTENGSKSIHCDVCDAIKEDSVKVIKATGHKEEKIAGKAATCTEDGLTEGIRCSVCGEILKKQEVIKAKGHKEEKIAGKAATCTEDGLTEGSKCSVCGEMLKKQEVIKATGHKWSDWEVIKEASETEEGIQRRVCANDKSHVETEKIPVLAHVHKLIKTEAKKPSCTEDGNKEYYTCSGCKKLFEDAEGIKEINKEDTVVKASGHKEEKLAGKTATCTEDGLTEGSKCSVCGEILKKQEVIKATGHKEEKVAGKAASCTEDGLTEGVKCSVCGEILKKQEVIKAKGHKEEKIAGKAASCTEDGLTEGSKCSVCGEILKKQEVIKATGHKEEKIAGKAATCTEDGLTEGVKCSVCGEILKKQEVIKATGHKEEKLAGKAATCTEDGLTEGIRCSVCGEILKKQEVIKATGHKWSDWEVIKEASETEEGIQRRVCANDKSHVETEKIPVLAHVHKLIKTEAKKPSCTEDGNKEYYTCSGCKKLFEDAEGIKEINKEDTVVKASGHKEEKLAGKVATCTEAGLTEGSKCSVCGEMLKKQEVIKATGHKWSDWEIIKEASETEEGIQRRACANDKSHVETEKIPVLAHVHKLIKTEAKKPSCTEDGNKEYYTCSGCKKIFEDAEGIKEINKEDTVVKTSGHKEEEVAGKAATCTEAGLTEGSKCSVCGEILKKQEVIKATGHKLVKDPAIPATTTATGLSEGSHCSVCGKIIVAQKVIPKKDVKGDVKDPTSVNGVEKKITENRSDGDIKGATFSLLQLRARSIGKNYINLSWTKVKGASGYIIYGNRCNAGGKVYSLKQVANTTRTSFKAAKLTKGTYYKYTAIAYKNTGAGQKVLASSKIIHVATSGGKVGNYKQVKLNKKTIKLKRKKVFKIKARQIPEKKKLKVKKHRSVCFESSNPAIATVSSSGKVKALQKGSCVIYVYSQSGIFNKVIVKVK